MNGTPNDDTQVNKPAYPTVSFASVRGIIENLQRDDYIITINTNCYYRTSYFHIRGWAGRFN